MISGSIPFAPAFMKTGISDSRLAPAENTSSGDQITRPLYFDSAISSAFCRPSMTSGLIRCSFAVMLAISTSPSWLQTRTSSLRNSSVPDFSAAGASAPSTFSGKAWRW